MYPTVLSNWGTTILPVLTELGRKWTYSYVLSHADLTVLRMFIIWQIVFTSSIAQERTSVTVHVLVQWPDDAVYLGRN